MKKLMVILFSVLFIAGLCVNADAERINPVNYGTIDICSFFKQGIWHFQDLIRIESTNSSTPPYSGGVSLSKSGPGYVHPDSAITGYDYESRAIMEFDLDEFVLSDLFYLTFSPRSIWAGQLITDTVEIYSYFGDGMVTLEDYYGGNFAGNASIDANISPCLWYTPNDIGGYEGDTYFDITSVVQMAQAIGAPYVGFNVRTLVRGTYTGILFRQPSVLGETQPIPEPATMLLLGSGLIGLVGFRRKFRKG